MENSMEANTFIWSLACSSSFHAEWNSRTIENLKFLICNCRFYPFIEHVFDNSSKHIPWILLKMRKDDLAESYVDILDYCAYWRLALSLFPEKLYNIFSVPSSPPVEFFGVWEGFESVFHGDWWVGAKNHNHCAIGNGEWRRRYNHLFNSR